MMRIAILFVVISFAPAVGSASPGSGPAHRLDWGRVGVWRGYRLAGQQIDRVFLGKRRKLTTQSGWQRVLEVDIAGSKRAWTNRCFLTYPGFYSKQKASCTFFGEGLAAASLTFRHRGSKVDGCITELDVIPFEGKLVDGSLELSFTEGSSDKELAVWRVDSSSLSSELRFDKSISALERELITIVVLTLQVVFAADKESDMWGHLKQLALSTTRSHAALLHEHGRPGLANHRTHVPRPGQAYRVGWERVGVWRGYQLAGQRIDRAFISEARDLTTQTGWQRVVETDIVGSRRAWTNRCILTYPGLHQLHASCTFFGEGLPAADLLWRHDASRSWGSASELDVIPFEGKRADGSLELSFTDSSDEKLADWRVASSTSPSVLRFEQSTAALERELIAVIVLNLQVIVSLDMEHAVWGHAEQRSSSGGALSHAALLREYGRAGFMLDPLPRTPRAFAGAHGGLIAPAGPDGAPKSPGGRSFGLFFGMRFQNFSGQLGVGLLPGAVDESRVAAAVGATDLASFALSLGLQARYAWRPQSYIQPFVGVGAALRTRFVEAEKSAGPIHGKQVGLALVPSVGLQVPLWKTNDIGPRVVLFGEFMPEWHVYADPRITGPVGTESTQDRLAEALEGAEWHLRTVVGLRYER